MPLAMAYVPWQEFENLYDLPCAYHRGTIFKDLDKPFECSKKNFYYYFNLFTFMPLIHPLTLVVAKIIVNRLKLFAL